LPCLARFHPVALHTGRQRVQFHRGHRESASLDSGDPPLINRKSGWPVPAGVGAMNVMSAGCHPGRLAGRATHSQPYGMSGLNGHVPVSVMVRRL
jgi:hypothetical protein